MTSNPLKTSRMPSKNLLGGIIKEMMETEMDEHLGYEKSERSDNGDYRNRYKHKWGNSHYGATDISGIDQKIISMYAKGIGGAGTSG